MKLFIKLRNKYFTALMSLVLLVMASIGLFNLSGTIGSVEASMISFDNEKTISITNGSFSNYTSQSTYPHKLNSFTTSGNNTASMKTGVINVSESTYAKNYNNYNLGEYENPGDVGTKEDYVLMINTEEDSNYTYTSSEFTLPANGYYYITVSAKTIGDSSLASVFLTKDNQVFEDCIISNITTKAWTNYTFFVATNAYESVKLKFGMQIGNQSSPASGCVLFDELHAGQISMEEFANCLNTFPQNTFKMVEFRSPNAYKNYNFDGHIIEFHKDATGEMVPTSVAENYFATSASGGGEKAVDINNGMINISTTDTYVTYEGKEEELQPNTTYRFSINVKSSKISVGSAFVKVEEIIDKDEEYDDFMDSTAEDKTAKSSNLTISSTTSNALTNGYEEYVIYVNTGALKSSKVKFSFGLGTSSANATGNVSFKEYVIERVPYSAYSSASAGSKIGKIDISERITLASSEFSNYTFDKMQSSSFDGVQYPATPTSWTSSSNNVGYQLSGVVNLSAFNAVMDKYSDKINKMSAPASLTTSSNNNVLMIYNGTESTQSYTSSSKNLSANKFYKVTTFVNTHMWNKDANGVTILAKTGNTILGKATDIKTGDAWQKVEFIISTPANSVSLTLELALGYGNKPSSGYAFFDNILVEEVDTADAFSNRFSEFAVAENGSITLDLTNNMLASTTTRDYNAPILFTGKNNGNTTINAGIVDLTGDLNVVADSKKEAMRALSGTNRNVLGISTALDVDGHYQYTSVISYNFESSKYYKLSFALFTDGIAQEDKEEKYDNGKLAEGANIQLTGLENATFKYVTSNGRWTNYEFYVGVNATTSSNLIFSLGSEFTGCYGRAFIGNIELTEVEKDAFTAMSVSDTVLKIDTVEQTDDEKTETSEKGKTNFNWAYIPTIATFLAIIVAVVGIFVRRNIKFKKRVGNKKAVYDRDITVMQNKYRRLASDRRDKEVRELTKECEELIALRTTYEDKYKEALSRLRSTRLANRDGSKRFEIAAIEREVKHISKEVARYGVQVNNYESEIDFMQTEAYLIDLEKQMMREDNSSRNQLRKEAELPEEKRLQAIAKRESKQARVEEKAKLKAEKLAKKQAKLQQEREAVEAQLAQAKAMDEQFVKEQELKKIRLEEEKLAKEKAKAEKELRKLEQEKAKQEAEKQQIEQQLSNEQADEEGETPIESEQNTINTDQAEQDNETNNTEAETNNDVTESMEEVPSQVDVDNNSSAENDINNSTDEQAEVVDTTESEQVSTSTEDESNN